MSIPSTGALRRPSRQRNILLTALTRGCVHTIFIIPVIALFWKEYGLSVADIFRLQGIFALSVILFEVPTGYLGDRLGRKKTLILSFALQLICWVGYAFAQGFWAFVVIEVGLGVAISFFSGTDSALLFESLASLYRKEDFTRIEGRQRAFAMTCDTLSALIGGAATGILSYRLLFFGSVVVSAAGLMASLFIVDTQAQVYRHPRGVLYGFYKIGRFVFLRSRLVRYTVPLMAACGLCTMMGVWLYQPLWDQLEIPVVLFGLLWAARSVPTLLASANAHRLEKHLGPRRAVMFMALPALAGYLILALAPGLWALTGILLVQTLFGLNMPLLAKYIHQETFDDKRATVMSIQSWLFRLGYFLTAPLIGWTAEAHSFSAAFLLITLLSALLIFPLTLLFLRRMPLTFPTKSPNPEPKA